MNRILLYVDPVEGEFSQVVTWAADLVEAATATIGEAPPSRWLSIGVVADIECCLSIGAVMLGRGLPRTVEHGERQASPVRLFPFRLRRDSDAEGESMRNIVQCLRDLIDAGAVEFASDLEKAAFMPAGEALSAALAVVNWEVLVALGRGDAAELRERRRDERLPSIIHPAPDADVRDQARSLLRLTDGEPDEWREVRSSAAADAITFTAILEQLQLR